LETYIQTYTISNPQSNSTTLEKKKTALQYFKERVQERTNKSSTTFDSNIKNPIMEIDQYLSEGYTVTRKTVTMFATFMFAS
jgi:hypothetical protein